MRDAISFTYILCRTIVVFISSVYCYVKLWYKGTLKKKNFKIKFRKFYNNSYTKYYSQCILQSSRTNMQEKENINKRAQFFFNQEKNFEYHYFHQRYF